MNYDPGRVRAVTEELIGTYGDKLSMRDMSVIQQVQDLLADGREVPRWQLVKLSTILQRVSR